MIENTKLKYNDSCIKIFELLKMLYCSNIEFKQVIRHISGGEYDGTSNTHVTLNKYLNALKIFGIKIKKHKGMYTLLTPLYTINFNIEDLKSINLLKKSELLITDVNEKKYFESFIHALEIRYDEPARNIQIANQTTKNLNFDFVHSETLEQLDQCEKFCTDKLKLEVIYISNYGRERNIVCSPLEVTFIKKQLCLKAVGNNGSRIYEIPLENIKSIRQLPASSTKMSIPTTVVYKISNGLARNYKLRSWEKLQQVEEDGSHIIVNKEEDLELLLERLMKYGTDCELISPKFLREEMVELINKTLSNYQ